MSKERKVVSSVKDHVEPPVKAEHAQKLQKLAEAGKTPQVIKEPIFLYSTLDYQEKLTYTNGEDLIIPPKSKQVVDESLVDKGALKKGFLLSKV